LIDDGCGSPLDCGPCGGYCGDGLCDSDEGDCLLDCGVGGPICGNLVCELGETASSCAIDCPRGGLCGNGLVDEGESCENCLVDLAYRPRFTASAPTVTTGTLITFSADLSLAASDPVPLWDLGDATHLQGTEITYSYASAGTYDVVLTATESRCLSTQLSAPQRITVTAGPTCDFSDLPPEQQRCCGDGTCQGGESPNDCPQDCPASCGDDLCTPGQGETADSCPEDCCFSGNTCAAGCAAAPNFTVSTPSPAAFEVVTFTAFPNGIVGPPVNWDFGDGNHCEGCDLSVTHRYERLGTHQVRLTATESVCHSAGVSFPQFITVGMPPMRDDAQMLARTLPTCLEPQQGEAASITVKNIGGTTWSRQFGQRLVMTTGGDRFAPAEILLPELVTVPPGYEWTFDFNLGSLGVAGGEHTLAFQMVNVDGGAFGEVALHLVRLADSCANPPRTGDYTCRVSIRDLQGRPVSGVQTNMHALGEPLDDKGEERLRDADSRLTDDDGVALLAVHRNGAPVNVLTCFVEGVRTTEPPAKSEAHPIDLAVGTHIDLELTLVEDGAFTVVLPGLKGGNATARLYSRGAYDKVVVIPTPFNPKEREAPFTDDVLRALFAPFMDRAFDQGFDVWLMNTKTGQNIHEQSAEFAQLIDLAARRLGPDGRVTVAGYSLGGVNARLTTARYQDDPAWRVALGVRPDLPVKLIAFGDAPLVGANIPFALQQRLWTDLPRDDSVPKTNLNSCGAQQLLRRSYPSDRDNFDRFWTRGEPVRFPSLSGLSVGSDTCDRVVDGQCECDAGPAVLGIAGSGWAHGIPMVGFADASPSRPQECYGDGRDLDFSGRSVCDDLVRKAPNPQYPFAAPLFFPLFRIQIPAGGDVDIHALPDDLTSGSRLSLVRETECKEILWFPLCGGIKYQYFSPTFIPFESALPPDAPFAATWHADHQAVHGLGVDKNINRLLDEIEAANSDVEATVRASVQPVDAATGSAPVTVTFPNELASGETTLTISEEGPAPFPQYVPGTPSLYYEIQSTVVTAASATNPIDVCIDYSGVSFMDESRVALFHAEPGGWVDITSFRDPEINRVCGAAASLSPFAVFEPANAPPFVTAGQDRTVEAQGPAGAEVRLTAAGSYDPDRDPVTYEWRGDAGQVVAAERAATVGFSLGDHSIELRAQDSRGAAGQASVLVSVVDTTAPKVSLTVTGGRQRTLSAEAADIVGVVSIEFEVDGTVVGARSALPYELVWDTTTVPDGPHALRAVARDAAGNVGYSDRVEILVDNTPPQLSVSATPAVLWPPNQQFVRVSMTVGVSDAIDPAPLVRLESVTCNDGCSAAGDVAGATAGTDDRLFQLRAKRAGTGSGRTYVITYIATDSSGNVARVATTVFVPHDQR
jgi:PKD repeat protein